MMNTRDLYTYHTVQPLTHSTSSSNVTTPIGTTIISYEIRLDRDLRNMDDTLANKDDTLAYRVLCTQRIVIPNQNAYSPGGVDITSFTDYPAIVTNQIVFTGSPELVGYSPRTLNSSVMTSSSSGSGVSGSTSLQHTSGSSTAQSNSFGASASIGFFGEALTGGISVDSDQTSESARSRSLSAGSDFASSRQQSSSDSMSVKDWACNAYLDTGASSPTWVWGQEYPWNVIRYRNTNGAANITLPSFVADLLYDSSSLQLLPPSALSQFGIDFTMSAVWTIKPAVGAGSANLTHTINYYTATHLATGSLTAPVNGQINQVTVTSNANSCTYSSPVLDLYTYGLDPIQSGDQRSVAVVGFVPRRFLVQPVPATVSGTTLTSPTPFVMLSATNNLLIKDTTKYGALALLPSDAGAGFEPSETALTAGFTTNCTSLEMTLSFKVVDSVRSYKLYMKHWMKDTVGVTLTFCINGDESNPIVKYVDAIEAEGGESNLLAISLRNLNYGSIDYHDYLQLGLNTVRITLTPIGGSPAGCGYQVRAISVEAE